MNQHKSKIRKIGRFETVDWSKLVGKQISTYWSSKPQLVHKNGTLEKKLLAFSRSSEYGFMECCYLIAHCTDGRYKQFCTSLCQDGIYPEDFYKALNGLQQKVGGKWSNVITLEFIHTHSKSLDAYDPLSKEWVSFGDPLSQDDIEAADSLAEQLYRRGVKNVIMTAASENGYSFKYFSSSLAPNSKYKKTKKK